MKIALLLLLQIFSSGGDVRFADELMRQSDYYRAITEYKRVLFYASDDSTKDYCLAQISEAYRRSDKPDLAIEFASELFTKSKIGSAGWYTSSILLGRAYGASRLPQMSLQYYLPALEYRDPHQAARLELGLTYFELKNMQKSLDYFDDALQREADTARKASIGAVIEEVRQYAAMPSKSPAAATIFSALLPGSGQAYSAHYYDAVQAFLYTAAASAGTYAMYRYEHSDDRRPLWTYVGLGLTATFYVSNVVGANQTAQYYNWKIHSDVSQRLRQRVMTLEE